jgi:methionine-rich copper-binding protein CopC
MRLMSSVAYCLIALALGTRSPAAQTLTVVETNPPSGAHLSSLEPGLVVRFNRPVDHIKSLLLLVRDDTVLATLHPRFKTEPEVLFATAPVLAPGSYRLRWSVRNIDGTEATEGEIPFTLVPK